MVIYGYNTTLLKVEEQPNITCTNCNETGRISMSILAQYVHFFFIPFCSIGKTGRSDCRKCGMTYKAKNMPPIYKEQYLRLNSRASIPVYHFSWILILILGVGTFSAISVYKKHKTESYLANPTIGDLYEVETDNKQYTLLKVVSVGSDSLYFLQNLYLVNKLKATDELVVSNKYDTVPFGISKAYILELKTKNILHDILRKD
jgi:hypothetical protein